MTTKNKVSVISPSFKVIRSKDVMMRGNSFYAIWDEANQTWTTDEFDAIDIIDNGTIKWAEEHPEAEGEVHLLRNADTGLIDKWHKYCEKQAINNYVALDESLIFSNTEKKRELYSSKSLPYPLEAGDHGSWDRLLSVLYEEKEAHKIEWCIGSIVSGASKTLQKFLVFHGSAGTGKSTILNVVQMLFDGYYSVFDARALGNASNAFALEAFKSNPLVAIQHDGDLSKIEDNTKLNSLVSHEEMTINEKFKSTYTNKFKAFLMMGTNKPVKITEAKSGLIRRLIDVYPSGNKVTQKEYTKLMNDIEFELSGIAQHCLEVYLDNPHYYDGYMPIEMISGTNDFYNFISDSSEKFVELVNVSLNTAWKMYKQYSEDSNNSYPLKKLAFRNELRNYFTSYEDRITIDGVRLRSMFMGFIDDKFEDKTKQTVEVKQQGWLKFDKSESIFDDMGGSYSAQYANANGNPSYKWENVKTTLSKLNTNKLHYVRVPLEHIVIDFDIPGEDGEKSYELNLEAASKWPATYAELSKSGKGIHLHYLYSGDANKLSRVHDEHIEVKVFTGNSSLRRMLTQCNDIPVATISSGLALKKEGAKMVDKNVVKNEKILRVMILRNIRKEYHSGTKPSVDFIFKLLNDAYDSGISYDVTDMYQAVLNFAMGSTNQASTCIKLVGQMKFKSEEASEHVTTDGQLVFYDVEVFPNLFLVNWKAQGENQIVHRLINPTADEIEKLANCNLVGFNNRRYDNHILYGRMIGYSNEQLYNLSQKIVNGEPNALFREAYNLSYTDVFDFSTKKQSLKKWEIELGLKHHELGLPWDQPVPEEMWPKVAEYCDDDVLATEAVFNHLHSDFATRRILAGVAGKSVNTSTNAISTAIVFGKEKKPQSTFYYRDMSKPVKLSDIPLDVQAYLRSETQLLDKPFVAYDGTESVLPYFPGYKFEMVRPKNAVAAEEDDDKIKLSGYSTYRGITSGEGGYVESAFGYYENVALIDVASMHPTSIISECAFGPVYTKRYKDIVDARLAVKHKDYSALDHVLDGALAAYADDDYLPTALKLPINATYGLTSAKFTNEFRNPDNVDNIVAKRGALFMIDLKYEIEARGFTVAHIKTDSIKIPNATKEIIDFVMDFGKKYGYNFEHEATYSKMCLVNKAVYIAKYADAEDCNDMYGYIPGDNKKKGGKWTATGTQFAVPYVFKTLFSKEPIVLSDYTITNSVKTAMYLKYDDDMKFVGKVGAFVPVMEGGGLLAREATAKDGSIKYDAVTGSKGYFWSSIEDLGDGGDVSNIDKSYYTKLVDEAVAEIGKYVDPEAFMD